MGLTVLDYLGNPHVEPSIDARIRLVDAGRINLANPFTATLLGAFNAGPTEGVGFYDSLQAFLDVHDPEDIGDAPAKIARLIFRPSRGGPRGAPALRAVRVSSDGHGPTRSTLPLEDAGAADVITLTSIDRGTHVNRLRAQVEAGTVAGRKLKVAYKDRPDWVKAGDNLGKLFALTFDGTAATATATITAAADAATRLQLVLTGAGDGATSHDLDLTHSDFDTVGKVINYINRQIGFTASVDADTDLNVAACPSAQIDAVAAGDIKSPASHTVTANIGAVIEWINQNLATIGPIPGVTGSRATGAVNPPAVMAAYESFTGGTQPAATLADYDAALDVLEREDTPAGLLVIDQDGATFRQAVLDWMDEELGRGRKWRAVFGLPAGTTNEAATQTAGIIGRETVAICHQRVLSVDDGSELDPKYVAAMYAGMTSGMAGTVDPQTLVLTNKAIRAAGIKTTDKMVKAARNRALDAGLNVLREENGKVLIALAVSTYQGPENFYRRWSETIAIDWIRHAAIQSVIDARLIVAWAVPEYVQSVRSTVTSVLEAFRTAQIITPGLDPETGDDVPAYLPPKVTVLDGVTTVVLTVSMAGETDHVRFDATIQRVALSSEG